MLDFQRPLADIPVLELPILELNPILDTWADGIIDPVELVGNGTNFRTTFFARMKLDGRWYRVPVVRVVRAVTAYRRNQLGDMLAKQKFLADPKVFMH